MELEKHVILCVDDEENILRSLTRLLRKEPYQVLTASDGKEGLEILEKHAVTLVLSDQRMPEMDGAEFLALVKDRYPDIVRICLTGYTDVDAITDAINKGHIYKFFLKPWNDQSLKLEIRQALEQYDLIQTNRSLHDKVMEQNEILKRMNENLELLVQERTQDLEIKNQVLELSHAILEDLPVAVVGIDADGMIVVINRKTQVLPLEPQHIEVGGQISSYFPDEVIHTFNEVITQEEHFVLEKVIIADNCFKIEMWPLTGRFKGKGLIMFITLAV